MFGQDYLGCSEQNANILSPQGLALGCMWIRNGEKLIKFFVYNLVPFRGHKKYVRLQSANCKTITCDVSSRVFIKNFSSRRKGKCTREKWATHLIKNIKYRAPGHVNLAGEFCLSCCRILRSPIPNEHPVYVPLCCCWQRPASHYQLRTNNWRPSHRVYYRL